MALLSGKSALVTGAAQGLGAAIAELFAEQGATVILSDLTEERCAATLANIRAKGHKAVAYALDVTSEAQWAATIDRAEAEFGRLDVLVNNAGISLSASIEATSFEQWRMVQSINLDSVFLGCKAAIGLMKKTGGSIINMSSVEGLVGDPDFAAYNASKGGVRLLTKSVALHCGRERYGICCNSIHPGFIQTPMLDAFMENTGDVEGTRAALETLHPVGVLGDARDIAEGALYLASDGSKFVTGTELIIDGGFTAR